MSKTIDCRQYSRPELLDVVDEEWARDTLPDDSERGHAVDQLVFYL